MMKTSQPFEEDKQYVMHFLQTFSNQHEVFPISRYINATK